MDSSKNSQLPPFNGNRPLWPTHYRPYILAMFDDVQLDMLDGKEFRPPKEPKPPPKKLAIYKKKLLRNPNLARTLPKVKVNNAAWNRYRAAFEVGKYRTKKYERAKTTGMQIIMRNVTPDQLVHFDHCRNDFVACWNVLEKLYGMESSQAYDTAFAAQKLFTSEIQNNRFSSHWSSMVNFAKRSSLSVETDGQGTHSFLMLWWLKKSLQSNPRWKYSLEVIENGSYDLA